MATAERADWAWLDWTCLGDSFVGGRPRSGKTAIALRLTAQAVLDSAQAPAAWEVGR
jgi:hypothetical protein